VTRAAPAARFTADIQRRKTMPRTILSALLGLLLVPALASAANAPAGKTGTVRADVQAFVKAYVDAANKADVTSIMEMYSRKSGVTSVSDGEIIRGWDAIRTDLDQIVGKEGSYKISVGSIDVTPLGVSYVLVVAPFTLTVVTDKGTAQAPSALTLVLEKSKGAWTIVHEHSSTKPQEDEADDEGGEDQGD
jgi:uncharacterized protein (TIGR02246 family)